MNYWIYLFGSTARCENDEISDLDVLIVYEGKKQNLDIDNFFSKFNKKPSISTYKVSAMKQYFDIGHLFAWHLFFEAKFVESNTEIDIIKKMGKPKEYNNFKHDVTDFREAFNDIRKSVNSGNYEILFESATFYTFLRNVFLFYLLKVEGKMFFSPNEVYKREYPVPVSQENFNLYRLIKHMKFEGKIDHTAIDEKVLINDLDKCQKWMNEDLNGILQ